MHTVVIKLYLNLVCSLQMQWSFSH